MLALVCPPPYLYRPPPSLRATPSALPPYVDPPLPLPHTGLGVKLVVVIGVQHHIDELLRERGMQPRYMGGYRLTDRDAMKVVIEAAGEARTQCEQYLSKVCTTGRDA